MVPEEKFRIVFFTHSEGVAARLLAEALDAAFGLTGIVFESRRPQRLKRRIRSILGDKAFRGALGLYLLLRHGRLERRLRAIEDSLREAADRELLERAGWREIAWPRGVPILATTDANGGAAVAWCRSLHPDLIVLSTMSLVREPVLALPRRGALNVHTSLLPDYRGPWPEFWQVLNGDTAAAGVTIHVATSRLDAGDIVFQKALATPPEPDPYRLGARNAWLAREILPAAVRSFLLGTAVPRPQGAPKIRPHRVRDRTRAHRVDLLRKLGYAV